MNSEQDLYLSPLENQWRDRLTQAEAWIMGETPKWTENLQLYNGKKKHMENRQWEYYANIIYQIYKTDKSQVCPLGLDFYAETDGMDRGAQENMLVSALLNNQLSTFENVKAGRKLHTQVSCKGVGVACLTVESQEGQEYLEVEGEEKSVPKSKDRIVVNVKKTEDVLYDNKIGENYNTLPWVAAAYTITAQEFRSSSEYKYKTEVLKVNGIDVENNWAEGTLYTNIIKQNDTDGGYKDPRFAGIKIWEVWDTLDRKKLHVEAKSFKIVKEEDYPIDNPDFNYPFVFISFTEEDVDEFPPIPEVSLLKDSQEAFNKIRSAQVRDVKRGVRTIIYNKRAFNNNEIAKITDGDKDQVIPFDDTPLGLTNGPIPAQNLFQQLPDIQPMPDAHNMAQAIMSDIQQTSGYGPMDRAGLSPAGTATETNAIAGFMADRRRAKLYEMLNFWQTVAKKSLMLMAELFPETIVVNSSRYAEKSVWKEFKRKVIEDRLYTIKVYVGSEGIMDRQRRIAEDMQMANILLPILNSVGGDASVLIKKILAQREWTPAEIDSIFNDTHEKAKQLAILSKQFMEGQNDPQSAMIFKGKVDELIQSLLSPQDIAELQGKFKQGGGQAPQSQDAPGVNSQRETQMVQDLGKGM